MSAFLDFVKWLIKLSLIFTVATVALIVAFIVGLRSRREKHD